GAGVLVPGHPVQQVVAVVGQHAVAGVAVVIRAGRAGDAIQVAVTVVVRLGRGAAHGGGVELDPLIGVVSRPGIGLDLMRHVSGRIQGVGGSFATVAVLMDEPVPRVVAVVDGA